MISRLPIPRRDDDRLTAMFYAALFEYAANDDLGWIFLGQVRCSTEGCDGTFLATCPSDCKTDCTCDQCGQPSMRFVRKPSGIFIGKG